MNETGHAPALFTVLLLGLILWRMYSRMRRSIGRQLLTPVRPRVVVILYPLIVALLGLVASSQPLALAALLGGMAAGAGLGLVALKLTRFEVAQDGLYYTPSAHIGVALTLLFVARVVYRMIVAVNAPGMAAGAEGPGIAPLPPLTMLVIGPLAGYYTSYFMGLLRWRARVLEQKAALTQPPIS